MQKWKRVGIVAVLLIVGVVLVDFKPIQNMHDEPARPPQAVPQVNKPGQTGLVVAHDDDVRGSTPWRTDSPYAAMEHFPTTSRHVAKVPKPEKYVTINDKVYPLRTYRTLANPNDPAANQWWVSNANLSTAWDITPGEYQTTLAVIDTGFALNHEDFAGRWHQNTGETGATSSEAPSQLNCSDRGLALSYSCNLVDDNVDGIVDNETGVAPYENPSRLNCTDQGIPLTESCNRIDDDNNGFIDDISGWDVVNQDNSVQAGELSPNGTGTTHGTMVAGIAAATGNNGKGIAGVDWNTKILPIQALDDDGYGDTRTVGKSIYYAIDQNADVINISLGTDYQDDYVREAIEAATRAGIVVVASSGNDGCDCVVYPARYPEVFAVGALDTNGSIASFSSWGSAVDITAPGNSLTLPSWSSTNQTTRYVSGAAGTSFASPLVAGIATLIKSNQPAAQPLHIIAALRETTNRSNNSPVSQPNSSYGFGKVDAFAARQRVVTPKAALQSYVFSPVAAGNHFAGQDATENLATYRVRECETTNTSIPLYELKNSATSFYTISETELRRAISLGYTSSRFAYTCLAQPHDTTDTVRTIDIFREFKNLVRKY